MHSLLLAGAAGYAVAQGGLFSRKLGCRSLRSYCWRQNPQPFQVSPTDLADKPWLCDPVETAVAFLNNCFIIQRYRSRTAHLHELKCSGNVAWVLLTFDNGEEMAFQLCRNSACGCRDWWTVCQYSYASLD